MNILEIFNQHEVYFISNTDFREISILRNDKNGTVEIKYMFTRSGKDSFDVRHEHDHLNLCREDGSICYTIQASPFCSAYLNCTEILQTGELKISTLVPDYPIQMVI